MFALLRSPLDATLVYKLGELSCNYKSIRTPAVSAQLDNPQLNH